MIYSNLSTPQLIQRLERVGDTPDPKLVAEILQREAEAKPLILQIFKDALSDDWPFSDDPRWYRLHHAARLLIAWREAAAAPFFAKLYLEDRFSDVIEWFELAIADLGPAALPEFLRILEKETNGWDYGVALAYSVVKIIALRHPETREQVVQALRNCLPTLSEEIFKRVQENESAAMMWTTVVGELADLDDEESHAHILALFAADLISEDYFESADDYLEQLKATPKVPPYYDILADYQSDYDHQQKWEARHAAELRREKAQARLAETQSQPKVGRNDPCPCGSGQKYKRCHGRPGAS